MRVSLLGFSSRFVVSWHDSHLHIHSHELGLEGLFVRVWCMEWIWWLWEEFIVRF